MTDNTPKWTELEHLPEWDEEFYQVFTAKKHGKWIMLKALKPEYAHDPHAQSMLEKEFDVRYNLAHPNIIMINDLEDVPGVGRSIITDDVYGLSLRKIIDDHKVDNHIIRQLSHQLVDAIQYIQENHLVHKPIRPESIIFTENIRNLKLIDVGFDQQERLAPSAVADDLASFGNVLLQALDAAPNPDPRLRHIALRCTDTHRCPYRSVPDLKLALQGSDNRRLYLIIIAFLALMTIVLGFFSLVHPNL